MHKKLKRFIKHRILHIDDTPRRIALGVAIGLFVAWTPLLGFHIPIALVVTFFFKANKFAALICVWASNAFTVIPVYYPNYLLGRTVLTLLHTEPKLAPSEVAELFENFFFINRMIANLFSSEFWHQLADFLLQIGVELFIGGFLIGGIISVTAYFGTYHLVVWYRKKHPHRRLPLQ